MGEQLQQIRDWLAGELYPEHETFSFGRDFAAAVIADFDKLEEENTRGEHENKRLRDAILDIDAHATALDEDEDGFVSGGYHISIGALHRALGVVGHTSVPCRECTPESHDCGTVNRLWTAMQRACNHPERWNEILSAALLATSGARDRPGVEPT